MDYASSFGVGVAAVIAYVIIFTIFGNLIVGFKKDVRDRFSFEEKRHSRKWWSRVRLPMDILRWLSVAMFIACIYSRAYRYSIAIIPFLLYDIYIFFLLTVILFKQNVLKGNQMYLLLGYTLFAGFPVGTYTKLALCLYADDILQSFAMTLMPYVAFVGPICGEILIAYIWIKYFCRCCGCTKHNQSCSCGCTVNFILLVVGLIISVVALLFFSAGSITAGLERVLFTSKENNTLTTQQTSMLAGNDHVTPNLAYNWNEIDETCYFNLFLPIKEGLPIMGMYVDSMETWAHMFVPVWCILTFMLLLTSVFTTHFITTGPKYHVILVLPDYITLWGYTITLLLVAYGLDNPNTGFSTVSNYGIPFYPVVIVEVICFIYNFIWFMKFTECKDASFEQNPLISKIRIGCSCCFAFLTFKKKERGCLWHCCLCLNCASCCRSICKPCFGGCVYCLESNTNNVKPSNVLLEEILMDDFGPEPSQKAPETDIQTWDQNDVCQFLSSIGIKFEAFIPNVLTHSIDGKKLMSFSYTDYENVFNLHGANDVVFLLKIQVECLAETLKNHTSQSFGAIDSVWCQSWYGLDDAERDNLKAMDYKSVAVWLYHSDCSDIRTLLCNQRVDGSLLHAYFSEIQHSHYVGTIQTLNNEQLVFIGAMNVLSLINYDFNFHYYLWDKAQKKDYVSILFPFWTHQRLLSYIEKDCDLPQNTIKRHYIPRKCNGSSFFLTARDMDGFFMKALKHLFDEQTIDFNACENCFYKLLDATKSDALQIIEKKANQTNEIDENEDILQKLNIDFNYTDKYLRAIIMQIDMMRPVLMTSVTLV